MRNLSLFYSIKCNLNNNSATLGSTVRKIDDDPTEEHKSLREMVRKFVIDEVEPQALEYNKYEKFNLPLFRKLGDLGLLGVTADVEYGGSGMDSTAAVIVHGK